VGGMGTAGGYGEMPSGSPMFKFGQSPMKVKTEFDQWQLPHTGLTSTVAAAGQMHHGQGPSNNQHFAAPGVYACYCPVWQRHTPAALSGWP
jgi:hypothetical protein